MVTSRRTSLEWNMRSNAIDVHCHKLCATTRHWIAAYRRWCWKESRMEREKKFWTKRTQEYTRNNYKEKEEKWLEKIKEEIRKIWNEIIQKKINNRKNINKKWNNIIIIKNLYIIHRSIILCINLLYYAYN